MNQSLLEFNFEAGKLVSQQNLSADNAKNIGAYKKPFETENLIQNIEEYFSLDIDME